VYHHLLGTDLVVGASVVGSVVGASVVGSVVGASVVGSVVGASVVGSVFGASKNKTDLQFSVVGASVVGAGLVGASVVGSSLVGCKCNKQQTHKSAFGSWHRFKRLTSFEASLVTYLLAKLISSLNLPLG
jgi:hypothetical protein